MPWYKGKTLLETFDDFKLPEKPIGKPLRLPIQDVYSITGVGTVPVGRVETGATRPNDKLIVMPSGSTVEVRQIAAHHHDRPSASAGDNIGFNLRGIEKKDIKRGDVLACIFDFQRNQCGDCSLERSGLDGCRLCRFHPVAFRAGREPPDPVCHILRLRGPRPPRRVSFLLRKFRFPTGRQIVFS